MSMGATFTLETLRVCVYLCLCIEALGRFEVR